MARSRVNDFEADGTVVSREFVFGARVSFRMAATQTRNITSHKRISVLTNRDEIEHL